MIFLSSTICVGFDAHASCLYIGRVLGETDYKIKVISGILEKSKSGKTGLCENLGVTLAKFSRSLFLGKGIILNF